MLKTHLIIKATISTHSHVPSNHEWLGNLTTSPDVLVCFCLCTFYCSCPFLFVCLMFLFAFICSCPSLFVGLHLSVLVLTFVCFLVFVYLFAFNCSCALAFTVCLTFIWSVQLQAGQADPGVSIALVCTVSSLNTAFFRIFCLFEHLNCFQFPP